MQQNSLIEIGSKANVIIRFKSDIVINGQTILKNEPYLFLKEVSVIVDYNINTKTFSVTPKNYISNSNIYPSIISIRNFNFSRKIASLISCFQNTSIEHNPTIIKSFVAEKEEGDEKGIIYLNDPIEEESNFYIYDSDFNKIETFDYDSEGNYLESASFFDEQEYLIIFSSVEVGTKFKLIKPSLPYMSLEIQGVGNIDKKTKKVFIYFDKVSLDTLLDLSFIVDGFINAPLNFIVLEGENYIVFED